ncbi:hypothetical protein Sjap_007098 [Stephania japonica]|uniref:Uncharacterized protein n=1 Tax=Stephania japonica TaxID=461633 RepID=A0AAP0JMH7_9MAGN
MVAPFPTPPPSCEVLRRAEVAGPVQISQRTRDEEGSIRRATPVGQGEDQRLPLSSERVAARTRRELKEILGSSGARVGVSGGRIAKTTALIEPSTSRPSKEKISDYL